MIEKLPELKLKDWMVDDVVDNRIKINELVEAVNRLEHLVNFITPPAKRAEYNQFHHN